MKQRTLNEISLQLKVINKLKYNKLNFRRNYKNFIKTF